MEEQVTLVQEKKQRRSTAPLAILALIVILAGLAAYLMVASHSAWDAAAYIPQDSAAAITLDLTSSKDRDAARDYIRGILTDAGVKEPEKELFKVFTDELGIDVERDVIPHLNGLGGAGVLTEMTSMMPSIVAVVGARSNGDADGLMKLIGDKLNAKGIKFQSVQYKGYYYYSITPPPAEPYQFRPRLSNFVGAVKSGIVYSNSEDGFKKVVDTVNGGPSLAKDPDFVRMRTHGGDTTFVTTYYSGPKFYKLVGPFLALGMGASGGSTDQIKEGMENTVAVVGNAEAGAEGIKYTVKGTTKKSAPQIESVSLDELVAVAPKNSALVVSVAGWDKAWPKVKAAMMSNPASRPQIDRLVMQAKAALQIDPFADVLDRVKALTFFYTPRPMANPKDFPGSLTLVLQVDKPEVVKTAAEKLSVLAMMSGGASELMYIAGQQVNAIPIDPQSGAVVAYTIVGDKLILTLGGTKTKDGMKDAIEVCLGKTPSAAKADAFEIVKIQLPPKSEFLVYGDAGAAINEFKSEIPEADRKTVEGVMKRVGIFGVTGSATGTESELQTVIPFKK